MTPLLALLIVIGGWLGGMCIFNYIAGRLGVGDHFMGMIWPMALPVLLVIYAIIGLHKVAKWSFDKGDVIHESKQSIIREQERIIKELEAELNVTKQKPTLPSYNKREVDKILAASMKFAQYEE